MIGKSHISGRTKICGIIGDPIEHSISPAIHNAAFQALGLDYIYVPFRVKASELHHAIEGIRSFNICGLNVTIPHKTAVLTLLDEVDETARKIGAVNTIVNVDHRLIGSNTDAAGFLQALLDKEVEPAGKKVVLLGAGGAARAIAFVLAEEKAELWILNRQEEISWAYDIGKNLEEYYPLKVTVDELNHPNLIRAIYHADILVNATSVGMSPNDDISLVPTELLCSNLAVFDIVYNPMPTKLLKEAREAGAQTIDGLDMLVWQGAFSFEKWVGVHPPVEVMRQAALTMLK